jgi:fused signal recognition particle receptor
MGLISVIVPTVERALPPTGRWSTTMAGERFSMASASGRLYRGSRVRMNQENVSLSWRCDSTAIVSNTTEDLPDPETPVKTVIRPLGMRSETPLRLLCRAPSMTMASTSSPYPSAPRPLHSPAVARDWYDLFITDDGKAPALEPEGEREEKRRGFFRRLRENMRKTREALTAEVQATLFEGPSDETWERLEEALIYADVGARTTAEVVERLEREAESGEIQGGEALTARLSELLAQLARTGDDHIDIRPAPTVVLVVGVNGTGKTTTIGKLAWHLRRELGQDVIIGAADTFRAAAVEQLEEWAQRAGCDIVTGPEGSDPGAVAFDAVARGRERGADVIVIDTAGRLHTQNNLMEELSKVRRVIAKQMPDAPHETLMTVDATTGQNGVRQAKLFGEAVGVTGIVLTKLDGTAKGGIALAIANELGIPVKLIGIGEQLEDLRPFDADDFARALLQ